MAVEATIIKSPVTASKLWTDVDVINAYSEYGVILVLTFTITWSLHP